METKDMPIELTQSFEGAPEGLAARVQPKGTSAKARRIRPLLPSGDAMIDTAPLPRRLCRITKTTRSIPKQSFCQSTVDFPLIRTLPGKMILLASMTK